MTADKRTDVLDAMDAETEVKFQAIPSSGGAAVWEKYIPSLYWLPKYSIKNFLISDIIGGITACIMLIPQGMGYALIAGLEPIYGLYSALFGPLIYGFFGTCGQITVAPMAVVSLMILQTVREYVVDETNPVEFAAIASAVTFQAGIILILLGLIKGGILASMLSRPVMIGFTAAAACLIGTSQLKFVFNVSSDSGNFIVMISSVIGALGGTHIPSLMLSIGSIIFLAGVKIAKKKWASKYVAVKFFPSELVMVVIGILVTFANQDAGFNIIGDIPKGLPPFKNFFGEFSGKIFWNQGLWVQSFLIAVLCFIESFAGGKKYADKFNYDIDASQELVALGICNAIGSWFGCYISGGALSRTVVVGEAGARSPLTALIAGVFMIIAIISLLGVFKFIPKPVLGCIVLVGVSGLFDTAGMKHLWKVSKKDFVIMCATVLLTLLVGIDVGVGAGVVLSIAIFVQESAKPHYSILGRTTKDDENSGYVSPDSDNEDLGKKAKKGGGHASGNKYYRYVDVKHEENLRIRPDMLMVRWDASLFFGNFSSFQKRISKHIERLISRNSEHLNTTENTFCLCLVFDSVISIDTTAIGLLYNFTIELKKKYPNVLILVHNIKKQVYNIFEKHELIFNEIPKNHIMHGSLYDCEKYWNKVLLKKFPDYFNRPIRMMTAKKIEPQYTESNIVQHASSHSGEIGVSYGDAENDIAEVIVTNEEV